MVSNTPGRSVAGPMVATIRVRRFKMHLKKACGEAHVLYKISAISRAYNPILFGFVFTIEGMIHPFEERGNT
jgi:hypothetical protein